MTDQTLSFFLDARQRTLENQLAALDGERKKLEHEIRAKQIELAEVLRFQELHAASIPNKLEAAMRAPLVARDRNALAPSVEPLRNVQRYAHMTIKECIIQALLDRFPKGATATDIRDFLRDVGRVIPPSSMRPQMSRLKVDGVLGQEPSTDIWNFLDGKRAKYEMFDHPTSRAGMKELQDDEVTQEETQGEPPVAPKPRPGFLLRRRPVVKLD